MSEKGPQGPSAIDIVESLVQDWEAQYRETHGRFSLVQPGSNAMDIIIKPNAGDAQRLLITPRPDDREIYDKLSSGGIPQFKRYDSGAAAIYNIPVHAKLLGNERLFADRPSSETYVSDRELYFEMGELWARIYKATGFIPEDGPLTQTCLLDFESEETRLKPVPPYNLWVDPPELSDAEEYFIDSVREQLQGLHLQQSFRPLLEAAQSGWKNSFRD
jgi:hypothetical protein